MNKLLLTSLWSLMMFAAVSSPTVAAQEGGWPRTLPLQGGSVTIYPLQVTGMEGDFIRYRAALAYQQAGVTEPVFGAGWFESRVEIDRKNGVVHPLTLNVSETRFPAGTANIQQELNAAFAQQSRGWNLDFPLSDLQASLEMVQQENKALQQLNTTPPTIIYRDHPALLVNIDGEPILRKIENSRYQAVINTPYPLIFDGRGYYLSAAQGVWYHADRATGPYRFEARPPAGILAMVDASGQTESLEVSTGQVTAANAPEIVVTTEPTELIVSEGPAAFVPLVDDLLVLSNSADDVFMHISSQQYYIVLAGRWYHSRSLNGPWTYRAADDLPPAFANIPQHSDQADSRVYVAGTAEARDAVMDAQIPQPAAVNRGPADIDVVYDGEPRFEPVEGTHLTYADNTASPVLRSDRLYYLVEDGVWYVSDSPNGPWQVSDYRPEEVAAISPRSPVYHVKYVYIYDSTPDVVYVGYTPGYTGSYIYHDTIVYGTGWYYRPWVSPHYYYPRYSTWGFNVSYTPWYGWNFGLSWDWGPFYAGYHSGGYWHHRQSWYYPSYGRWGPAGYRPHSIRHNRYAYGRGGYNRAGYDRDRYDRDRYDRDRYDRDSYDHGSYRRGNHDRGGQNRGGYDRNRFNGHVRSDNLYRDRAQRARIADYNRRGSALRDSNRQVSSNAYSAADRRARPDYRSRNGSGNGMGRFEKGGNTTRPVKGADLRAKAQHRDARFKAEQRKVHADSRRGGKRHSAIQPAGAGRAASHKAGERNGKPRATNPQQRQPEPGQRSRREAEQYASANRERARQQRSHSRPTAPVRNAPNRAAPRAGAPKRNVAPPRAAPQRSAPQRAAPQHSAPQRYERQRSAPQRAAPQRNAPQRYERPRSAPQRAAPQRSAPHRYERQRSAPQRNAPQRHAQAPTQRSAVTGGRRHDRGSKNHGGRRADRSRSD